MKYDEQNLLRYCRVSPCCRKSYHIYRIACLLNSCAPPPDLSLVSAASQAHPSTFTEQVLEPDEPAVEPDAEITIVPTAPIVPAGQSAIEPAIVPAEDSAEISAAPTALSTIMLTTEAAAYPATEPTAEAATEPASEPTAELSVGIDSDDADAEAGSYFSENDRAEPLLDREGLNGRGLLSYRNWWEFRDVVLSVGGALLSGTPAFMEKNTLRVINDEYSYFIPLEKVDYIRTNDGLKSSFRRKPAL